MKDTCAQYSGASGMALSELTVLFVDDEENMRLSAEQCLQLEDFNVLTCSSAREALKLLTPSYPGVLVTDIRMPGMTGLELMDQALAQDPDLPVILLTGHGDIDMAVSAMHRGAFDFQQKPFDPDHFIRIVGHALHQRALVLDNRSLRKSIESQGVLESLLVGISPQIQALRETVLDLADLPVNVLIHGETGSGKEQVATCLHQLSLRRKAPYVALNCAAMPEHLFESEVFGFEKGAFTGADRQRVGKLEYARGGTVFLDEIETMPLNLQVKLLRVLQEMKVERLGSNQLIDLDFRLVAATKTDLMAASEKGEFREDLYFRLNVAEIHIPPLRERREDIPLLFTHFICQLARDYEREAFEPDLNDIKELMQHNWPGNVRELKNIAQRFVFGRQGQKLGVPELMKTPSAKSGVSLQCQMRSFERSLLENALRRHQGQVQPLLEELDLPRRTFNELMKKHGLERKDYC